MLHMSIEKSILVSKGQECLFHGRAWTVPWAATACHGRHTLVNFSSVKLPDMRLERPTVLRDRYRIRKNLITCNDVPSRFEAPRGKGSQDSDHQTVNEESQNTPRPSGNFIASLLGDQSASFTLDTQVIRSLSNFFLFSIGKEKIYY